MDTARKRQRLTEKGSASSRKPGVAGNRDTSVIAGAPALGTKPQIIRQRPTFNGVAAEVLSEIMRHVRQAQLDLVLLPTPPGKVSQQEYKYPQLVEGVRCQRANHWIVPSITQSWRSYAARFASKRSLDAARAIDRTDPFDEEGIFEDRVRPAMIPPMPGSYGDRMHLADVPWELLGEGRVFVFGCLSQAIDHMRRWPVEGRREVRTLVLIETRDQGEKLQQVGIETYYHIRVALDQEVLDPWDNEKERGRMGFRPLNQVQSNRPPFFFPNLRTLVIARTCEGVDVLHSLYFIMQLVQGLQVILLSQTPIHSISMYPSTVDEPNPRTLDQTAWTAPQPIYFELHREGILPARDHSIPEELQRKVDLSSYRYAYRARWGHLTISAMGEQESIELDSQAEWE